MRNFLSGLGRQIRLFLQGRYGYDELSRFISILSFVFLFLSWIPNLRFLYFIAVALLICSMFRSLSRNISKRLYERSRYLEIRNGIKGKFTLVRDMWRDRKTHRYYRCPNCRAVMRIAYPGKGRLISVHCRKCGNSFDKKT